MPDDAELLRRYADIRDEPAFAALVARHLGLVYVSALRRLDGDPHRAADVAQNVFIALARHASSLAQRPVFANWLHTATRHAVIDLLRAEHRRRTREHHAHTLDLVNAPEPTPTPASTSADWDRLRPLRDTALDELSEPDRAILLLRFFKQHSFATLAVRLHLTGDAARMRTALASRLAAASVKKIAPPGEPSPMPTAAPFHPPPPIPIRASTTVYGPFPATDLRWWNDKAPVSG